MKRVFGVVLAVAAGLLAGSPWRSWLSAQNTSPVTVQLVSPGAGSTVSGIVQLTATASSSAGPISKVEFYVDGKLIGTVTNKIPSPQGFNVQ